MVARKDFPMVLRRLMAMQVPKAPVLETMVAVAIFLIGSQHIQF